MKDVDDDRDKESRREILQDRVLRVVGWCLVIFVLVILEMMLVKSYRQSGSHHIGRL